MKKTTLLIAICFAFQFNAMSQILIPDVNFETRLVAIGVDTDGIVNGEISVVDAANASGTLNISNQSIVDFTGIEGFTGITGLNASYNAGAASLDISSNTSLTFVSIEGCSIMTTLTTTGITSLVEIQAEDAVLNALDVTTNTALQTLNVRNNNIAALDLSNNVALVSMQARNNILTDLDMRNGNNANVTSYNSDLNNGLMCIFVDDAALGYATYFLSVPWNEDGNSTFVDDQAECNLLSVETENENVFSMFPNPVKHTVFVNVNVQDSQLTIYDITGKLVLNKSLNFGENAVNVSHMSSGVYLARFASDSKVQTKKLIIQ